MWIDSKPLLRAGKTSRLNGLVDVEKLGNAAKKWATAGCVLNIMTVMSAVGQTTRFADSLTTTLGNTLGTLHSNRTTARE